MHIFKHSNEKQVSISSLVIFRRISLPMNSCGGCPVGTWGVSQVNLMKNSAVIGSWMPKLTKARLNEGSEVKIGLAFASGLPCLAHWILQVTKFIFAITNWLQLVQVGIKTWLEICSTARKSFCGPLWKQEVTDWRLRGHKDTREDTERETCTCVHVLTVYTYTPMQINTHFPHDICTQGHMYHFSWEFTLSWSYGTKTISSIQSFLTRFCYYEQSWLESEQFMNFHFHSPSNDQIAQISGF